ncbi:MAG: hypothetical protein HYT87_03410 [Nitrospirae bacterium]|nr:hypothetical protein [Nitrospirota bacterium]
MRLANGETIEREYGPCLLRVMEGWYGTTVLMAEDTDIPLLGTNTMDDASVEIDLRNKKLVHVQAIQARFVGCGAARLFPPPLPQLLKLKPSSKRRPSHTVTHPTFVNPHA